ncbi:hypothetical protein ACET3Z_030397 [Daucus carota]
MKMSSVLTIFSSLLFSLGSALYYDHWPFLANFVLVCSLFSSFVSLISGLWLIPGGFAWRGFQGGKNISGPMGWPVLGILPQMGPLAHQKLAAMALAFRAKGLMAYSLGSTRVIISSRPETAKEILSRSSFSDRPVKESARLLMFERAIGFSPSGDYWRNLRRLAANHMFSPRRIAGLEGLRQSIASEMIDGVSEAMNLKNVVEVKGILQKGALRNMIESVFGSWLNSEAEELGFLVKEGYELIAEFNWSDYFPLGFLDFYGVKRRCHALGIKVSSLVGEIIKKRRSDGEFIGRNDFLSVLLSLPKEDQLSDADMVAVLWEMIFRGTDTVAIVLEWTLARMVMYPDIQEKARQEINTCTKSDRHVRDGDMANLPYLQSIVKEVLRLHPPGPLLSWARLAIHDVHVGKFFVPAGTTAMVNMWAITHDPTIWKDPWAFKPERYIEEEVSIMGSDLRLAPFGSGRRICPGRVLGLSTVHLWLARLLQEFKWLPAQPVDLSECLKLSLELKKPLSCYAISCRDNQASFSSP